MNKKTTKLPSAEERVESLQVTSELETNEQYLERVQKIMQQDRNQAYTRLVEIVQEHIWPGEGNKHTNDVLNAIKDKIDTVYGKK